MSDYKKQRNKRIAELQKKNKEISQANKNNSAQILALIIKNGLLEKQNKEFQEENARLKKDSEENQNLATIAYMQGASKYKAKLDAAKEIIKKYNDVVEKILTYKKCDTEKIAKIKKYAEVFLSSSENLGLERRIENATQRNN